MEIDRSLLRDRAFVIKHYAQRIVANAEKIEAISKSRAKPERIAEAVNSAAGYIEEFWRLLTDAGRLAQIPPPFDDPGNDASIRTMAASLRALDLKWETVERLKKQEAAGGKPVAPPRPIGGD